jgi:hypothetical protein
MVLGRCRSGSVAPSEPYEFMGFGAMDATKPFKFVWLADIHGPNPYKFIGFRWAFISDAGREPNSIAQSLLFGS